MENCVKPSVNVTLPCLVKGGPVAKLLLQVMKATISWSLSKGCMYNFLSMGNVRRGIVRYMSH
jgi:hypothetical protein